MNIKKIKAISLALAAAAMPLSACTQLELPQSREIDQYEIATALGIDKLDGLPAVTVSSQRGQKPFVLTNSGMTVAEAFTEMSTYSKNMLILSNVNHVLIGEKALENDLPKYIDYIARQPSIRLDTKIYAVHGATARMVLTDVSTEDDYITNRLKSLEKDVRELALAKPVSLLQLLKSYSEEKPLLMPAIVVVDREKHNKDDKGKADMDIGGLVILTRAGAIGYVEPKDVPGCNFVLGSPTFYVLEARDEAGALAALNVECRSTNLSMEFGEDGAPKKLRVKVELPSEVIETHRSEGLTDKYFASLRTSAEANLKTMIEKTLYGAQKLGVDYLQIGERLMNKNREYMDSIDSDEWNKVFSMMEMSVEVSCEILHSYDISGPLGGRE